MCSVDKMNIEPDYNNAWKKVWNRKSIPESEIIDLEKLIALDGFDTGFGSVSTQDWIDYVKTVADQLGIMPGHSVFEVGCGSGAFLYCLDKLGCTVSGMDYSQGLVNIAVRALPNSKIYLEEAANIDTDIKYDYVISNGVFFYFKDIDYADLVMKKMLRKARFGVAVLDVPDLATRDECIKMRMSKIGADEYEEKYRGLDHLYFDRQWFRDKCESVVIDKQILRNYENASYRYNVFVRRK